MKTLLKNIPKKTNIGVLVVYVFFAFVTFFAINSIRRQYAVVSESSVDVSKEITKKMELLQKLNQNSNSIHINLLQFKIDSDIQQKRIFKQTIDSLRDNNSLLLLNLTSILSVPTEKILLEKLQKHRNDYSLLLDNYILLTLLNYPVKDPEVNYKQVKASFKLFKTSEKALIDYEHERFSETLKKTAYHLSEIGSTIQYVLFGFIIISFLFSLVALNLYFRLKRHYKKVAIAIEEKHKATTYASSILNALPAHVAMLDRSGIIIEVNRSWRIFLSEFGYEPKCSVGANLIEVLEEMENSEETDQVVMALRELLSGNLKDFSIIHTVTYGGQKKWFRVIANRENQSPDSGVIIMYLDITDKQEAEKKSKQAEARLIEFNENSQDIICSIDAEGNFIHVSSASKAIWGYESHELRGKNFRELVHKDDLGTTLETASKIIGGSPVTMFENRYVHKDGRVVPMLWSARWKEDEKTIYCIARDASEKKKAELELKTAETNYREIFEKASNGILILNAETGEILKANQKSCEITGLKKEELLNHNIASISLFIEEKINNGLEEKLKQAFKGIDQIFELEIEQNDGQPHWIEVICTKANIAGTASILVFFNQIDGRKKAELTNAKITAELIQRNLHLQEFAYIVSHNLRAPISSILGLSNIIKGELSAEEKVKSQTYLFETVEKLDLIVKDLNHILELRTEIAKKREYIDLDLMLNTVTNNLTKKDLTTNVKFLVDFTEAKTILSLRTYLHSIFENLISNSIKYRKANQTVLILIKSERIGKKIRISFKDNGLGIDLKQYGSKLFGLYNRFHHNSEGKGMGLFLVKNHVEILGGSIIVKSEPNVGTEFIIDLPLEKNAKPTLLDAQHGPGLTNYLKQ